MEKVDVYGLLRKYNTFVGLDEAELEMVKDICENHIKLNRLASRYMENRSNHTLGTLLETFNEIYPTTPTQKRIVQENIERRYAEMKAELEARREG
jgi:hypothetical protein